MTTDPLAAAYADEYRRRYVDPPPPPPLLVSRQLARTARNLGVDLDAAARAYGFDGVEVFG